MLLMNLRPITITSTSSALRFVFFLSLCIFVIPILVFVQFQLTDLWILIFLYFRILSKCIYLMNLRLITYRLTRWSPSGHKVVTKWSPSSHQVVVKAWISNSLSILKQNFLVLDNNESTQKKHDSYKNLMDFWISVDHACPF